MKEAAGMIAAVEFSGAGVREIISVLQPTEPIKSTAIPSESRKA